jgi:hypothetical protein
MGGINNRTNPGKPVSSLALFIAELTQYFGLDFRISNRPFRTVIILRNLRVGKKSKDALFVFYQRLIKACSFLWNFELSTANNVSN